MLSYQIESICFIKIKAPYLVISFLYYLCEDANQKGSKNESLFFQPKQTPEVIYEVPDGYKNQLQIGSIVIIC